MKNNDVYVSQCLQTHPLCQQNMRGCRPTSDLHSRLIFLFFSVIALGCALLTNFLGDKVKEYSIRYDNKCNEVGDSVTINFQNANLDKAFVYYELHGFYQNHFRISSSYSAKQMNGVYDNKPDCFPGDSTDLPCGLLPRMFFNDTYDLPNETFTDKDINYKDEIKKLYSGFNTRYYKEISKYNMWMLEPNFSQSFPGEIQNEHFVQWMKISMHPDFRKLYAKSIGNVPANLKVTITCNYPKEIFDGKRYLVLAKIGRMGGKNRFISYFNFFLFAMNLIFCGVFFLPCMKKKQNYQSDEVPLIQGDEQALIQQD